MNIRENGFEILESFLPQCEMQSIKAEVNEFPKTYPKYGIRGANDKFQTIQQLCSSEKLTKIAESILMGKANQWFPEQVRNDIERIYF
ncbi:hypothetical protein N473_21215 [Pseudoalteromonas luteoviolacea CPMOR-1]|uniref:Uncharacterized protein n=1 Tax=Pseudoalteromonas luteoviolacea CPMOR-1 TaxID=1365248 RepID=A0A162C4R0_9GAMM|nr:hypothetical protein [Pseudoalteromonas luteoviolacea]KZN62067.1 hypothetical protein N473_21215 [Pseudoalteromonas luteoviolacea CPMOR-1]